MPDTVLDPLAATADAGQARGVSPDPLSELVDLAVEPTVAVALRAVREMLGMEVAYLSKFVGEDAVLRAVEGEGKSFGLAPELSMPRHHTYCQGALDGRLSNLIPDARADDRTASMAVTKAANVGAFATVPLTFSDGRLYGTLCAASHDAKSLDFRALQFLKVFARLLADQLERDEAALVVGHLAALVNAAGDAIMCLTSAGMVTSWNAACERIFGYAATDAIGHDIIDLIALPSREADMRRSLASAHGGEVVHRDGRQRRADGVIVDTAVTLSPIRDEHGEVSFVSAVCRDISVAVLQARYRAIEGEVVNALEIADDAAEATAGMLRGVGEGLLCDIGALWELDQSGKMLRCSSLWVKGDSHESAFAEGMREARLRPGEELPGCVWTSGEVAWIEKLRDIEDSPRAAAAVAEGLRSAVGLPLRSGGEVVGVIEFLTRNESPSNPEMLAMGEALVGRLADALGRHRAQEALRGANHALEIRVRDRTADLRRAVAELDAAQAETVRRLSRAVEFRDEDPGAHIARISAFAARTAQQAGLDAEQIGLIERASPLHDVGKVAIPDSVLLKPGPLTPAERAVIETHAEIGHRLLDGSDSAVLQLAAIIALTHHEHYDGGGYPQGLAGENIPIEGRIVAIADVFDALTSDRVYRPAMTVEQALAILQAGRGTHFDPVLLDHFLADLHHEPLLRT